MALQIKNPADRIDHCRHLQGSLRDAAAILNLQPAAAEPDDAAALALCIHCFRQTVTAMGRMKT